MARWRTALAAALVAGLSGCASPNPDFYTLVAIPGPPVVTSDRSIELRRVSLAGYLDRPEIVRATAAYRVHLLEGDRWGEPLGGMLDRVFTEDLVNRLPGTSVFEETGAISTQPDAEVEIDVQRFDADADGTVVLLAQIAIRHDNSNRPAVARTVRLTATPASPSTQDLVAAMSRALGEFANRVAQALANG